MRCMEKMQGWPGADQGQTLSQNGEGGKAARPEEENTHSDSPERTPPTEPEARLARDTGIPGGHGAPRTNRKMKALGNTRDGDSSVREVSR